MVIAYSIHGMEPAMPSSPYEGVATTDTIHQQREAVLQKREERVRESIKDWIPPPRGWTPLDKIEFSLSGIPALLCRCDCGYESYVSVSALLTGKSKSCKRCLIGRQRVRPKVHVGDRFGALEVIEDMETVTTENGNKWRMVVCRCSCGNIVRKTAQDLQVRNDIQCIRCYRHGVTEQIKQLCDGMDTAVIARLYSIYKGILQRCYNERCGSFKHYGGKGIEMCQEWLRDIKTFLSWAKLQEGHADFSKSIDRINVMEGYGPQNCRFATDLEQARNRSNARYIDMEGVLISVGDFAKKYNISYGRVLDTLNRYGSNACVARYVNNIEPPKLNRSNMAEWPIENEGKVFSGFRVINEPSTKDKKGHVFVLCECVTCGDRKFQPRGKLMSGNPRMCIVCFNQKQKDEATARRLAFANAAAAPKLEAG